MQMSLQSLGEWEMSGTSMFNIHILFHYMVFFVYREGKGLGRRGLGSCTLSFITFFIHSLWQLDDLFLGILKYSRFFKELSSQFSFYQVLPPFWVLLSIGKALSYVCSIDFISISLRPYPYCCQIETISWQNSCISEILNLRCYLLFS